jgi:soluble lytic murein transglycosylase
VQERKDFPGPHRRQWQKILFRTAAVLITAILFSGILDAPGSARSNLGQLQAARYGQAQPDLPSLKETLAAFKRGLDLYLDKRYAQALGALPNEQEAKASLLGDYFLLYRGKSNLMVEQLREALGDFRLLRNQYPNSPLVEDALTDECQVLLKLKDPRAVLALLGSSKIDPNSETLYLKARAHQEAGEKEEAIELYLRVYSSYPGSPSSPLAERYLLSLSPKALAGRSNYGARLERAEGLLKAADSRKARALLLTLGRVSAPDSASSEKRNLLFAEAEYRLGRVSAAIPYFHKVTAADPALHARAICLEGMCYRKLDREAALLAMRDKALKLYPGSPDTEELCYSTATYFDLNYEPARAREAYRIFSQAFPKSQRAERALWQLSILSYQAKQYDKAALDFWNYVLAYPNPLQAGPAIYWMGRCYENFGDSGNAKYLYMRAQALANDSYYGQRAREAEAALKEPADDKTAAISGIDFNQVIRTCNGIGHLPVSIPAPGDVVAPVIERARALAMADLPEFALSELRWGIRRYPQEAKALSYIMSLVHESAKNCNGAIASLRKIFPDYISRPASSLPDDVWQRLFPVRHWETISSQAARNGMDPTLILAVIRQESGFEEKAKSRANARGLMQILPSTGRQLARHARIARYSVKKLFDAETNITLGTRYLASLLQEYGRPELALAAYNAGTRRVDRWLEEFGDKDMAQFVEQIPFSETRNYVKQVLSNKIRYDLITPAAMSASR